MDLDRCLISRVLMERNAGEAIRLNMSSELLEGQAKEVWAWVAEKFRAHGETPSAATMEDVFPSYSVCECPETISFYCEGVREKFLHNCCSDGIRQAVPLLKSGKPAEAKRLLAQAVRLGDTYGSPKPDMDWSQDPMARYEAYLERKKAHGVDGVSTPFPTLDEATMGFHPGELIFLVARTKTGKTWFQCLLINHNIEEGDLPLIFSNEMSNEQVARRVDALHYQLPYEALRTGSLPSLVEARWKTAIEECPRGRFLLVENPGAQNTVTFVAAKIHQHKPAVAYVDGMYLMDDETGGASDWLRLVNISRGLKLVARETGVPIVVTMQLTDDGDVARSKGVRADADAIIALEQSADEKLAQRMHLRLLFHREGQGMHAFLEWNFETMTFRETEDPRDYDAGPPEEQKGPESKQTTVKF